MKDLAHSALTRSIPTELVARLEAASVGSRRLDYEVREALDDPYWNFHVPADWTTSLDAAVALVERVLPGWQKVFGEHDQPGGRGAAWKATLIVPQGGGLESAWAPTPALALCIALLKAIPAVEAGSMGMSEANEPNTALLPTTPSGEKEP